MRRTILTVACSVVVATLTTPVAFPQASTAQDPVAKEIPNYTRPDEEIAFAGQPPEEVFAKLKEAGFQTILSLRSPDEIDFDEKKAAEAEGLTFVNIPITSSTITDDKVAAFSRVVQDPENKPLLIHCGAASRVGGMWYIYRALFDKAPEEQSLDEALARGLDSPALEAVVKDYVASRKGQQ
ncbi:MAG: fused DSP-PTPase phosphatase/NAD kinase-like protein [Vicinamibacteria bacterium]